MTVSSVDCRKRLFTVGTVWLDSRGTIKVECTLSVRNALTTILARPIVHIVLALCRANSQFGGQRRAGGVDF